MELTAEKKVSKGKVNLILDHPFFGSLIMKLKFSAMKRLSTMATDGVNLFYGEKFVDKLTLAEFTGVLAHEVLHCANNHMGRREGRDMKLWNIACDYAINPLLLSCKFELPKPYLHDTRFNNMAAEQIYSVLKEEASKKPDPPTGPGPTPPPGDGNPKPEDEEGDGGGSGDGEGGDLTSDKKGDENSDGEKDPNTETKEGSGDDNTEDETDGGGSGSGEEDADTEDGDSGSGNKDGDDKDESDGKGGSDEGDADDHDPRFDDFEDEGGCGGIIDAKDPEENKADWEVAVGVAANSARKAGKLPASLESFVKELQEPKIPWREVLRRFVENNAKNDYSWTYPSSRYAHTGMYLPSIKSDELDIVVAIDSSGSVSDEELNQFIAEVDAISKELHATMTVMCCDTQLGEIQEFTPYDTVGVNIKIDRRGGTEFKPVFDYVEKEGLTPKCLVYLTDLCCYSYPKEPDYPTLWVKTGDYGEGPPFGEVVELV